MSITEGLLLNTFTIHGRYTEKYYLDADSAIYNDRYVYGAMKQHNLGVADIVYEYFCLLMSVHQVGTSLVVAQFLQVDLTM